MVATHSDAITGFVLTSISEAARWYFEPFLWLASGFSRVARRARFMAARLSARSNVHARAREAESAVRLEAQVAMLVERSDKMVAMINRLKATIDEGRPGEVADPHIDLEPAADKILQHVDEEPARGAIESLLPHLRAILFMRYVQSMTISEIAALTGDSLEFIGRSLSEAKQIMREELNRHEPESRAAERSFGRGLGLAPMEIDPWR